MEFLIADTFIDSLAKLTSEEQKGVKTTAFDLQTNPANPGKPAPSRQVNATTSKVRMPMVSISSWSAVSSRTPRGLTPILLPSGGFVQQEGSRVRLDAPRNAKKRCQTSVRNRTQGQAKKPLMVRQDAPYGLRASVRKTPRGAGNCAKQGEFAFFWRTRAICSVWLRLPGIFTSEADARQGLGSR